MSVKKHAAQAPWYAQAACSTRSMICSSNMQHKLHDMLQQHAAQAPWYAQATCSTSSVICSSNMQHKCIKSSAPFKLYCPKINSCWLFWSTAHKMTYRRYSIISPSDHKLTPFLFACRSIQLHDPIISRPLKSDPGQLNWDNWIYQNLTTSVVFGLL